MDRRLRCLLPALPLLLLLTACGGGGKGSSAAPPANFQAAAQDQAVTASWSDDPSLDYWIFIGPPGTTPDNFTNTAGAYAIPHVTTPYSVSTLAFNGIPTALTNFQAYDITINARSNGGPGGPSSAPVRAVPRPAGGTWTSGTPLVNQADNLPDDLLSATYGVPYYGNNGVLAPTGAAARFVASGNAGALFYTQQNANGIDFTFFPTTSGLPAGTNLGAVSFDPSVGFLTAGPGGLASASLDGISWTPQVTGITFNINGIASLGGSWLGVGDGCNIVSVIGSGNPNQYTSWTSYSAGLIAAFPTQCGASSPASLLTSTLGSAAGSNYVVVGGTQGLLAFSPSTAFTSTTPGWTQANLILPAGVTQAQVTVRGLAYGSFTPSPTTAVPNPVGQPLFAAVGDYLDSTNTVQPLILYSYDLANWTAVALPASLAGTHLRSVAGIRDPASGQLTQLVAVGDAGVILRSNLIVATVNGLTASSQYILTPGQVWTPVTGTTTSAQLNAVVFGHFGFEALGAAGTNLHSF